MERSEITSIGDVLRRAIQETNMQGRLDELRAADLWPRIVGPDIASRTMKPLVRSGNMTIRVVDSSLRHELSMHRTLLLREINRLMKKEVILSIRFIG
ncbi:MAG: DUF721 domain-containing protein [Bacteroides sp.]|nr:DUF721 domain-containing protein [Bacteroidales bacterium]MBD5295071.1 DUF721 domain-containing protein [Bacteroides sp.]MDE6234570.1 DUF721 domain-containing protein [Muribaculaceae bacterium]